MKHIAYLAVAVALIAPSAAQNPARVEIVLANFKFTPSAISLKAGQPVTLHFVNQGSGGHDFTAPEFFKAATMDTATRAKLGKKGRIDLSAGDSADVTLTPKVGNYKVKCGHFLHAGFGMTGTIIVS
ncbi:MAG: cupredoxin domain-containing protein [Sphingomonadaceae bacterium]|nr:cupredoxin domain-containing protein [Sphingomonadaceae bacterium]